MSGSSSQLSGYPSTGDTTRMVRATSAPSGHESRGPSVSGIAGSAGSNYTHPRRPHRTLRIRCPPARPSPTGLMRGGVDAAFAAGDATAPLVEHWVLASRIRLTFVAHSDISETVREMPLRGDSTKSHPYPVSGRKDGNVTPCPRDPPAVAWAAYSSMFRALHT